MNTFKVGDTVQLKSGGPVMTVVRFRLASEQDSEDEPVVTCQWFIKNEVRTATFHPDTLEIWGDEGESGNSIMMTTL